MPLMKKTEYAALKGWSKSYLSKKDIKEKIAPAMTVDEQGRKRIDSDIADQIFAATADPAREHLRKDAQASETQAGAVDGNDKNPEPLLTGYQASRAEREAIKVEQDRLDLLERKGKTLDLDQVVEAHSASAVIIREHLSSAGRRIAEKASTMTDSRAIKSMFDEEMRSAFLAAHHDFTRRIPNWDGDKPTTN